MNFLLLNFLQHSTKSCHSLNVCTNLLRILRTEGSQKEQKTTFFEI